MRRSQQQTDDAGQLFLRCPACGNSDYFLEVMASEGHIVNGELQYVRLAYAETEEYRCLRCDEVVTPSAVEADT